VSIILSSLVNSAYLQKTSLCLNMNRRPWSSVMYGDWLVIFVVFRFESDHAECGVVSIRTYRLRLVAAIFSEVGKVGYNLGAFLAALP
jgi:hypothetical protein